MLKLLLGWTLLLILFIAALIIPVSEFGAAPLAGCIIGSICSIVSLGIFSWQVYSIVSNQNPDYSSLWQLLSLFVLFNLASSLLWFSMWLVDASQLEFVPAIIAGDSFYYVFLVVTANTLSIFCTAGIVRVFPVGVWAYLVHMLVVVTGGFMWLLTGMWFIKYRTRGIQFDEMMTSSNKKN